MRNPQEEITPPETLNRFTLIAEREGDHWSVTCPEWKCQLSDKSATRAAARIIADIETTIEGGPEDWNTFAEREGLPRLRPEAQPKATPPLRGGLR